MGLQILYTCSLFILYHIYNKSTWEQELLYLYMILLGSCVKTGWYEGHQIFYIFPFLSFFICRGLWINPSATKWPPTYQALALNCLKFTFSLTGWFMNILFPFLPRNVNYIQQEDSWRDESCKWWSLLCFYSPQKVTSWSQKRTN